MVRLADIATVRRGHVDPPTPMFRVNGREAIGLGIAMRDGGDILALGQNVKKAMATVTAGLPLGIEPYLVADQAVTVSHAIDDFMMSLWQAVGIIMVVSFISLGVRPGLVVAPALPLAVQQLDQIAELCRFCAVIVDPVTRAMAQGTGHQVPPTGLLPECRR